MTVARYITLSLISRYHCFDPTNRDISGLHCIYQDGLWQEFHLERCQWTLVDSSRGGSCFSFWKQGKQRLWPSLREFGQSLNTVGIWQSEWVPALQTVLLSNLLGIWSGPDALFRLSPASDFSTPLTFITRGEMRGVLGLVDKGISVPSDCRGMKTDVNCLLRMSALSNVSVTLKTF